MHQHMQGILLGLIERLESIGERDAHLFDSDVRQRISNAIIDGFVRAKANYVLPDEFGLLSQDTNSEVKSALREYIVAANAKAAALRIASFHDRLAAVQNEQVYTAEGNDYEEFLGHSPPEWFDTSGNVVRTN